jgi:hypothetical protein
MFPVRSRAIFLAGALALMSLVLSGRSGRAVAADASSSNSPSPAAATMSKPELHSLFDATPAPAVNHFQERETELSPNLTYQKEASGIGPFGRSARGTLLYVAHPSPGPVPTGIVSNGKIDKFTPLPPQGGYDTQTGLAVPHPPGQHALLPPRAPSRVAVETQFDGDHGVQITPSDMQLSVGANDILQVDNNKISVWSRSNTNAAPQSAGLLAAFNVDTSYSVGDPWITYDQSSQRWFLSALLQANDQTDSIVIAISPKSDPRGKWLIRNLAFSDGQTVLRDQPKIGVTNDKVIVAWDEFVQSIPGLSGFDTLSGGNWLVLPKADLLTSDDTTNVKPELPSADKCISEPMPVRNESSDATGYIVATVRPDSYGECNHPVPTPSPVGFTGNVVKLISIRGLPPDLRTTTTLIRVAQYSAPNNISQAGTKLTLFSGDTRVVSAVRQGNHIYAASNDSCKVAVACFRFISIPLPWSPTQRLEDYDVGVVGRAIFYPSLTTDGKGDVFAVVSQVRDGFLGAAVFSRLAGHEGSDWGITTIATSNISLKCPQTDSGWDGTATRIGDYAGADHDPMQNGAVWLSTVVPAGPVHGGPFDPRQCPQRSIVGRYSIRPY